MKKIDIINSFCRLQKQNCKTKMSWDLLPTEIRVYILDLRYSIRNDACEKIQNAWTKYILPDLTAIDIALDIETDQNQNVMVTTESTELILKKCLKISSGKHHIWFWQEIAEKIKESLLIEEYNGGPWAVYYNRTENAYNELVKKFGLEEI